MNTIIEKIRAEVNRLKPRIRKICGEEVKIPVEKVREKFDTLLSVLSDLEKEEKPTLQVQPVDTSEDERINTAIFKALSKKDARDVLKECGVDVGDALDYLKRQSKEQPVEVHPLFRVGDYVRNKTTKDKVLIEQLDMEKKIYFYFTWDGAAEVHSDFSFSKQDEWELIGQTVADKQSVCEDLEEYASQIVAKLVPSLGQKYHDGRYVGGIRDYFSREELIGLVKAGAKWKMEQSELPCEGLEEEIGHWLDKLDDKYCMLMESFSIGDVKETARHFYELGRSEKPNNHLEQPVSEGLEEEISRYLREECSNDDEPSVSEIARHFAQWGAEHTREELMKEAVEGFIFQSEDYYPKELIANYNGELKHGDKVRIIIVKEEAKKPVPNDLEEAAKYIDEDDFD